MNSHTGLTSEEANKLLVQYGKNDISSTKRFSLIQIFWTQFKNFLIVLLVIAALISFFVGEALDAVFILVIIILNALLGFFQEYKAENALAALQDMTISKVRVIRDGVEQEIDSRLLVPGDIIKLSEGDKIPADARILESMHAEVNEASLTGESMPVEKNPHDKEQNMLYMGTIVTSGKATTQVTHTGFATKFGKMAASLSDIKHEQTPLMRKIAVLGKQLSSGAIGITLLIFLIGIVQGRDVIEMLQISISLAVAAIPEGLPAVITITLAIGLQRMAKQKAILRKLGAIEGLGNTTVVATDKTGTLTENKMRVAKFWIDNATHTPKDFIGKKMPPLLLLLLKAGVICNNATLVPAKNKKTYEILGDPTEGSLLLLSKELTVDPYKVKGGGKLVDEFSFDAKKKMMSVIWEENGQKTLYAKGAPETILSLSSTIVEQKRTRTMTAKDRSAIQKELKNYQEKGLRVLSIAKREPIQTIGKRDEMEKNLTFIGFVGIADPARTGLREVLMTTEHAGIQTIMVTGDNPITAASIGEQIGLLKPDDRVVTGMDLTKMSDRELEESVESIRVFARTTPEDKFRIVTALQKKGHIVTVTGDGVNDALALKKADVGVAMG
ncbi:HAD-IC family P-type ATPase, partial [Candidatus Roizmanbacteria bacterium]|nr:HAD-IC family P-type ATPase [Candidatus Roizmanbacteria bacterium]